MEVNTEESAEDSSDGSNSHKQPKYQTPSKQQFRSENDQRYAEAPEIHNRNSARRNQTDYIALSDVLFQHKDSLSSIATDVKTNEGSIMLIHRTLNEKPSLQICSDFPGKKADQNRPSHGHDIQKNFSQPSEVCTYDFMPACSHSGITYSNRCILEKVNNEKFAFYGFCQAKRKCMCLAIFSPVCGIDGKTYSNKCTANCAGLSLRHLGRCK